jgi:DNA-binding XRE family transcriptional regulator
MMVIVVWQGEASMDHREFQVFRQKLGKTQKQLSQLLGTSLKAIQSFEQGWRKVPVHIERQMLFLLTLKKTKAGDARSCWDVRNCSVETRRDCPAWEFDTGSLCWFINGTLCQGKPHTSWSSKMKVCRKCEVFRSDTGASALKRRG